MDNVKNATKPKALIIGGDGFVGNYLKKHLQQTLHFDTYITQLSSIPSTNPSIFDLDILDKEAIYKLLYELKPEYIFHLAAQSSVGLSWQKPELTVNINIQGTLHLLETLKNLKQETHYNPRTLLIGSSEEYGYILPEDIPLKETTLPRPGNIYAITKNTQNQLAFVYHKAYQLNCVSTRSFNHIGPGQSPAFVVSDFCKQVVEIENGNGDKTLQVGNLSAKRDFTDVRDVVIAYGLLIEKGVPGETYNVGSGKAFSIEYLLKQILSLAKTNITYTIDPNRLRPAEIPLVEADISKIQTLTNWKPSIPLKNTLEDTLNDWRLHIK